MVQQSPRPPAQAGPRNRFLAWIRAHGWLLAFAVLVLAMAASRGYWAPDEPDFAQCVKEMRSRGDWLLPYLNGLPYSEKPILFYWLMKVSALALERLTVGLGFQHGIAAWALRLPSLLAGILFLGGLGSWVRRFLPQARLAVMILATTPLWIWQAQFIQIDMLFAALLAWSWLSWLAGWLLLRGHAEGRPGASDRWFQVSYLCLALAVLAKGPLALVLSAALVLSFLALQRDLRALGRIRLGSGALWLAVIVLPWYFAAGLRGGPQYAWALIVHQNLERALKAWDHIQPWWRYGSYVAADFFPWSLALVPVAILLGRGPRRDPALRFAALAFLVPLLLLSLSQSKQGKYILMAYPFLALLLALGFDQLERQPAGRIATLVKSLLAVGLGLPALALAAVGFLGAGGHRLQAQLHPFLGPLRLVAVLFALGAAGVLRNWDRPWQRAALALTTVFLVAGTWGLRLLDPQKDFREWHQRTEPLLAGRQAFFWGDIRSGAMIYSDRLLPELHGHGQLPALPAGTFLVTPEKRWRAGFEGLQPREMQAFEPVCRQSQGGDGLLLLRRRGS